MNRYAPVPTSSFGKKIMEDRPTTFDQLPAMVSAMRNDLILIKELLQANGASHVNKEAERWLSLKDLCDYLPGRPAAATVYSWVHARKIPHQKFGKRLAFLKSEIDIWLRDHKRQTISEIEEEAESHLSNKKRRK